MYVPHSVGSNLLQLSPAPLQLLYNPTWLPLLVQSFHPVMTDMHTYVVASYSQSNNEPLCQGHWYRVHVEMVTARCAQVEVSYLNSGRADYIGM